MNLEARTRRKLFSFLSIAAFILAACGAKTESALPSATATFPLTPTPTLPSPLATSTAPENCVTINPPINNAYRAWFELGKPEKLKFNNLAGPDGDGSTTEVNSNSLPILVHWGDEFCARPVP